MATYKIEDKYDQSEVFEPILFFTDLMKESFKEYLMDGMKIIEKRETELKKRIEILKESNPSLAEVLAVDFEQKGYKNQLFRQAFINSTALYLYSRLEDFLDSLCVCCKRMFMSDLNHATYRHECKKENSEIDRKKHYIIKVSGIDFTPLQKFWSKIDVFRKIRNLIAHSDNKIINNNYKHVIKLAEIEEGIKYLKEHKLIIIEPAYLQLVMDDIYDFLHSLMEAIYIQYGLISSKKD